MAEAITNDSEGKRESMMFSEQLKARIKEVLASKPEQMTPEERDSVFSDELVAQIKMAVSSSTTELSAGQIRDDTCSLIERVLKALKSESNLHDEKRDLRVLQGQLQNMGTTPNAQQVRRLSTQFFSIIESTTALRTIYIEVTEQEIKELLLSKPDSPENL